MTEIQYNVFIVVSTEVSGSVSIILLFDFNTHKKVQYIKQRMCDANTSLSCSIATMAVLDFCKIQEKVSSKVFLQNNNESESCNTTVAASLSLRLLDVHYIPQLRDPLVKKLQPASLAMN